MAYITNLNELEEQFDIEKAVDFYESSKGKKNIKCPFHSEKTASFAISQSKNIATCFGGCGTYSPVQFVKAKENCSYVEAIEKCAAIHNLVVKYDERKNEHQRKEDKEKLERKENYYALNKSVHQAYWNENYKEELNDDDVVTFQDDKNCRTLKGSTVKKFGVCHTPNLWDYLQQQNLNLDHKLLLELGLIRERKDKQGYYDFFRNRQLFPLKNRNGKIVGFGGRKLELDDKIAKYLNSEETIIYRKSEVLYGYDEQKRELIQSKTAYLSEGYWDVLTPYNEGFKGVVGNCGTALTKRQAQMLKRYVEHVVMIYDNDEKEQLETDKQKKNAGLDAAKKALPILLEEGLRVSIVILPAGEDVDSFIRKNGIGEFRTYLSEHQKDAFMWYVKDTFHKTDGDAHSVDMVSELAIDLLKKIDKNTIQEIYIKDISKLLGVKESTLTLLLREKQGEELHSSENQELDEEQRKSLLIYGIYEYQNQYFCYKSKGNGFAAISNFVVKPLFLLESPTDPKRLFEIVNKYEHRKLIDIEGTSLIDLGSFKKTTEPRGNFRFFGSSSQYELVKSKIYDLMSTCYEIDVMGYHKDGFYSFGNGIYTIDKGFLEANEYGIVTYQQKQYFLPAFSTIYKDSEVSFADEKNFIYKPSKITFEEWAKLFCEIHGNNGKIALCFYLAALFRHGIKNVVKFPLLNLFGQPASGKSLMLENLTAMFGMITKAFNLNHGTDVGFANKLITVRNGLIAMEEYKNDISKNKIEGLKGVYDDVGRERGQKTASKNIKTLVHSTCVVVGQELPTADIALFTRCVSLAFAQTEYTQEEKDRVSKLIEIRDTGELSSITAKVSTFREYVIDNFQDAYFTAFAELKNVGNEHSVSSRMIENNSILLAIYDLLSTKLAFPFNRSVFFKVLADNMLRQSKEIGNENEISAFWDIVEFLGTSGTIQQGVDYKIDVVQKIKDKTFSKAKRVIYLSFNRPFALYLESHKKQHGKPGLPKASMLHYLKTHHAFIDMVNNTRFNKERSTSAYVFDYDALNIALPYNVTAQDDVIGVGQKK